MRQREKEAAMYVIDPMGRLPVLVREAAFDLSNAKAMYEESVRKIYEPGTRIAFLLCGFEKYGFVRHIAGTANEIRLIVEQDDGTAVTIFPGTNYPTPINQGGPNGQT